ncbi:MAG: antitoxin VapB family protein [Candidatus Micrarchaeota archaeon]
MVHVITIDDESYSELFKVKRQNDCSFSKAIKHLIAQNKKVKTNVLAFAGSVNESDIDMRSIDSMEKSMQSWARRI